MYLADGDVRADHHNAAPPDLCSGVTALVDRNSESRLVHTMALASCAESVTNTNLVTAGTRAAQR